MTLADLIAGADAMTLEQRYQLHPAHRDTEEGDWHAFKEALAILADGGADVASLMGLLQRHGTDGATGIYMAWRARRIEERKPAQPKRRRR